MGYRTKGLLKPCLHSGIKLGYWLKGPGLPGPKNSIRVVSRVEPWSLPGSRGANSHRGKYAKSTRQQPGKCVTGENEP